MYCTILTCIAKYALLPLLPVMTLIVWTREKLCVTSVASFYSLVGNYRRILQVLPVFARGGHVTWTHFLGLTKRSKDACRRLPPPLNTCSPPDLFFFYSFPFSTCCRDYYCLRCRWNYEIWFAKCELARRRQRNEQSLPKSRPWFAQPFERNKNIIGTEMLLNYSLCTCLVSFIGSMLLGKSPVQ